MDKDMKIIKTFKDGTVLVSSDEGNAIMELSEYERLVLKNFNLANEILIRLKSNFSHCTFSIHEIKSRDHIFMDDNIDLTNISIGSLEFWMRDQRMTYDEVISYLESKIMPSIIMEANKIEHERCKEDMHYFFRHYVRNKGDKD